LESIEHHEPSAMNRMDATNQSPRWQSASQIPGLVAGTGESNQQQPTFQPQCPQTGEHGDVLGLEVGLPSPVTSDGRLSFSALQRPALTDLRRMSSSGRSVAGAAGVTGNSTISPSNMFTNSQSIIQNPPTATPPCGNLGDNRSTPCETDDKEPRGPSRFFPIFSDGAIDWMSQQSGLSHFVSTARRLAADFLNNEKLHEAVQPERAPEPDFATAMKWTAAFFDEGLDAVYGVLHRPALEARLRSHFEQGYKTSHDPAWYALRNAIYALGCRISLSADHNPKAFTEARKTAWRYFENALSVHTYLIYYQTGLDSIRALLLMAFFAEALSSPALEYMLISNTARLAQLKSMHLQVSERSSMAPEVVQERQRIWWCIYSYDKHLAYCSGRPSVRQSFTLPSFLDLLIYGRLLMTMTSAALSQKSSLGAAQST